MSKARPNIAGVASALPWLLLILVIVPVLRESFAFRFLGGGRLGPSFWNLRFFYYAHGLLALVALLMGGVQFNGAMRRRRPHFHRRCGRAYVMIACVSAAMGMWLAIRSEFPGWRVPLSLLGLLWLGFTLAGWQRARLGDFTGHRRAMTRSYATALAFVSTRLLAGPLGPVLLGFIADPMLRATTAMWLGVVAPLVLLEGAWGAASLIGATARAGKAMPAPRSRAYSLPEPGSA